MGASGSIVTCSIEGTRPILLEIQALVCKTGFGLPRRTAAGADLNRVKSADGGTGKNVQGFRCLPAMLM